MLSSRMRKVVVTGLGFASSIGSDKEAVAESLKGLRHGFAPFPGREGELCPPKLYGPVPGFHISGWDPEDWVYPERFKLSRSQIKSMPPNVLYAYCAVVDALADAGLERGGISDPRTGLYSASSGSSGLLHESMKVMNDHGVGRVSPLCVVSTAVGTINFNLGAIFSIQGSICGFASACASSAHALGFAGNAIAMGRQDRMIVIGAEDNVRETILPFSAMRALSEHADPRLASCPFDTKRSGFVGSGGAACLILESEEAARARGATVYAELAGWGESGDGHSPAMSHPEGRGMAQAMRLALDAAGADAAAIDYVNAHATSTVVGDLSEIRALRSVFGAGGPMVSSTKALTGHALSMAGALEAAICCLAMREGFVPGSAHIDTLDPEAAALNIIRETKAVEVETVLSNSSGFGGANVSLVFKRWQP